MRSLVRCCVVLCRVVLCRVVLCCVVWFGQVKSSQERRCAARACVPVCVRAACVCVCVCVCVFVVGAFLVATVTRSCPVFPYVCVCPRAGVRCCGHVVSRFLLSCSFVRSFRQPSAVWVCVAVSRAALLTIGLLQPSRASDADVLVS